MPKLSPHYLFLTNEEYDRRGFDAAKYVMTPPLRDAHHQRQLWRGLRTDDLQVVSTDHCPFCFNEQPYGIKYSKQQGRADFSKIPNGAPGIETRLPLIHDGGVRKHGMSLNRFVELARGACRRRRAMARSRGPGQFPQTRPFWRVLTTSGSFAGRGIALAPKRAFKRFPQPVRRGGQTLRAIARSCRARAL